MTLHTSLVVNIFGMGLAVAVHTLGNVAMAFTVAIIARQLCVLAGMLFQLSGRAWMAFSTVGQQLFYIQACQGCMGFLMASFT